MRTALWLQVQLFAKSVQPNQVPWAHVTPPTHHQVRGKTSSTQTGGMHHQRLQSNHSKKYHHSFYNSGTKPRFLAVAWSADWLFAASLTASLNPACKTPAVVALFGRQPQRCQCSAGWFVCICTIIDMAFGA